MRHRVGPAERPAIPDDNAPLPPARRPTRWTVRRGRTIAFVLLGLALAAGLLSVYFTYESAQQSAAQAAAVNRRLSVLEDDLAERTRQRDAERDAAQDADAEFRARLCVVLGELPVDGNNLDHLRATLGCTQPGVDPAAPPAGRPPAAPSPGGQSPERRTPSPSPTATPPASHESSRDPLPAPGSPDGLLCGLLPLC